MKNVKSLAIFVGLCMVFVSKAQVNFGIKAGLNSTTISEFKNVYGEAKTKLNFNFGIYSSIKLSKKINLQPELLYNVKGSNFSRDEFNKTSLTLNYLSIPVLLHHNINKNLAVGFGPGFNFLLNKPTYFYNGFDLSALLLLTYKVKNIGIEIRYDYGLSGVTNGTISYVDVNGNLTSTENNFGYNKSLSINLLYQLTAYASFKK